MRFNKEQRYHLHDSGVKAVVAVVRFDDLRGLFEHVAQLVTLRTDTSIVLGIAVIQCRSGSGHHRILDDTLACAAKSGPELRHTLTSTLKTCVTALRWKGYQLRNHCDNCMLVD